MILDTSFVIDVFGGEPAARSIKDDIDQRGTAAISAVTAFELAKVIERTARTRNASASCRSLPTSGRSH